MHIENYIKIEEVLDNADNVANALDERDLATIGKHVVEGYMVDRESRSEWEKVNENAMKLALQVVEDKSTPWDNASNVKYPMLTTAALQFSARAYPALIPNNNIVKGRVIGSDKDGQKLARALRIGKHMSYQLIEEMDDWEEDMDKLCLALPILGCLFKKTYRDEANNKNVSEVIYPWDLVVNYWTQSIDKAPRVTHALELSENDVYERTALGLYRDVELRKGDRREEEEGTKDRGLNAPQDDETAPYNILEQHLYIDLDGDGYAEPYVVTVHEDSEEVLRIIPRFEAEDIQADGEDIIRINGTQYFTKFGFIPSPDGSLYDLGFGTLLGPLNDTINTVFNQLIDAGTLSNLQAGFISKGVRVKGGNHAFKPGEWKQVNVIGDDLRKGIMPLPVRDPSNVLFQLLNTMVNAGERLSSVTEMMTGELPGQNTKASVAMASLEQGMKVFSAIYKRIHRALKKELRKLYDLNKKHITGEEYFMILDVGQETADKVDQHDYQGDDADVVPYADPTVATEMQRIKRVESLANLLKLGTVNVQEFTKRYIEATEQPSPELLMQPNQPKPNPEFELKKMELEIEEAKRKDESALAWAKLELEYKLAGSKMSKEEIEGIVKLSTAAGAENKQMVDAIQKENELRFQRNEADRARREGLGEPSNNN